MFFLASWKHDTGLKKQQTRLDITIQYIVLSHPIYGLNLVILHQHFKDNSFPHVSLFLSTDRPLFVNWDCRLSSKLSCTINLQRSCRFQQTKMILLTGLQFYTYSLNRLTFRKVSLNTKIFESIHQSCLKGFRLQFFAAL